jgi:hypothetical protein
MNPMRTTKSIAWELLVGGGRLWRLAVLTARWARLGLGLAVGFPLAAQEPAATLQTNDVAAAAAVTRAGEMVQSADAPQSEDMPVPEDATATDEVPQVNGLPPTNGSAVGGDRTGKTNRFDNPSRSTNGKSVQGPGWSQNDDRRFRGKRSRSRSSQGGGTGSANDYSQGSDNSQSNLSTGTNGALARLDYSAFKIIVDRNIFDPNRFPRRPGQKRRTTPPKSFDSVTLVGTMSYENGTFAFFDGTSSEYQKALKLTDAIAGYKVTDIAPNSVKLVSGTNELELSVGTQLRREENGPWLLAGQFRSYVPTSLSASTNGAATTTTTSSDAAASASDSDIIKKLMEKRAKE